MTLSCRKKIRVSSASSRFGPGRRAGHDDPAARPQRPDRVRPGRLADGLHDRVDLDRQPGAGLEDLVRAELERPGALGLVAAGRQHPQAGGPRQRDHGGGDAAAGALHQHGLAGACSSPRVKSIRYAVSQAVGRQAASSKDSDAGFGTTLRRGHGDLVGERALVALGEQRPLRVEGLVAGPRRVADHGVDDDLVAVLVEAGGVAAEDHRQRLLAQPDAAQRQQVVVVERRGLDGRPSSTRRGPRGRVAPPPAGRRAGRPSRSGRRRRRTCARTYRPLLSGGRHRLVARPRRPPPPPPGRPAGRTATG